MNLTVLLVIGCMLSIITLLLYAVYRETESDFPCRRSHRRTTRNPSQTGTAGFVKEAAEDNAEP